MLTRVRSTLPAETESVVERTIGCALRVHRELGPGFLEGAYQDAMGIELDECGLVLEREYRLTLHYRGQPLRTHRLDLLVEKSVVVEIEAVERLESIHHAQVIAYLRAAALRVGLLINFNAVPLKAGLRRIVL
jgi:GxxExxY protein